MAVGHAIQRGVPLGSGGSRLLRGNHAEHEALESEAAAFFGSEAALYFSTGYAANAALPSTRPQRGDLIVHDALVHASAHEGMRLGRAATMAAPHNDAQGFDDEIASWRKRGGAGRPWIAVESLYSMGGDRAPLSELTEVATRHDAALLIDEAHATGVSVRTDAGLPAIWKGATTSSRYGPAARRWAAKARWFADHASLGDSLINRGRGFIFSTAPSPLMAAAMRESQLILADEPERRERLWELIAVAERVLTPHGVAATGSQILPLIRGDDARTMRVATALQVAGFDVRGIRPPTVPAGTSRLIRRLNN